MIQFKRFSAGLLLAGLMTTQLTGCFGLVVAGAGTAAAVANDRRPSKTVWNDQQIEMRVAERIGAKFGTSTHVNVNSFNRKVLLSGETPDAATQAEVARIASETPDVAKVYNETTVALTSTVGARAKDVTLTTRIKARMADAGKFSPVHVMVTSERGSVFLMGLVTRKEGADAAQITSNTEGVERVVTLFDYID
ncbi:BON domain-containing protein [Burkholderiaceae bacterium DAT-1]|nr:BON domain-containing protein [Burkholderiaceae bacterium DAT-1]